MYAVLKCQIEEINQKKKNDITEFCSLQHGINNYSNQIIAAVG